MFGSDPDSPLPMSSQLPTRLEATRTAQASGLQLHFAWAGLEISDERQGVVVVPRADGRLNVRVIGYPALTGLADTVSLLDAEAPDGFSPASVRLDGQVLVCLEPHPRAPSMHRGFTLALAPAMANFLRDWLPRLARVAMLAQRIASHVSTLLEFATTAHGSDVCAELVAALMLDHKSVDAALIVVAQEHWAGRDPAWQAAFASPTVRQRLEAIVQEVRGGRPFGEPLAEPPKDAE